MAGETQRMCTVKELDAEFKQQDERTAPQQQTNKTTKESSEHFSCTGTEAGAAKAEKLEKERDCPQQREAVIRPQQAGKIDFRSLQKQSKFATDRTWSGGKGGPQSPSGKGRSREKTKRSGKSERGNPQQLYRLSIANPRTVGIAYPQQKVLPPKKSDAGCVPGGQRFHIPGLPEVDLQQEKLNYSRCFQENSVTSQALGETSSYPQQLQLMEGGGGGAPPGAQLVLPDFQLGGSGVWPSPDRTFNGASYGVSSQKSTALSESGKANGFAPVPFQYGFQLMEDSTSDSFPCESHSTDFSHVAHGSLSLTAADGQTIAQSNNQPEDRSSYPHPVQFIQGVTSSIQCTRNLSEDSAGSDSSQQSDAVTAATKRSCQRTHNQSLHARTVSQSFPNRTFSNPIHSNRLQHGVYADHNPVQYADVNDKFQFQNQSAADQSKSSRASWQQTQPNRTELSRQMSNQKLAYLVCPSDWQEESKHKANHLKRQDAAKHSAASTFKAESKAVYFGHNQSAARSFSYPPLAMGLMMVSPYESPSPSPVHNPASSSTCSSLSPASSSPVNVTSEENQLSKSFYQQNKSQLPSDHLHAFHPDATRALPYAADRNKDDLVSYLTKPALDGFGLEHQQPPPPYSAHQLLASSLATANLDQLDVLLTCKQCDQNFSNLASFLSHKQFCAQHAFAHGDLKEVSKMEDSRKFHAEAVKAVSLSRCPSDLHLSLLGLNKNGELISDSETKADNKDDPLKLNLFSVPSLPAALPDLEMEDAKLDSLITEALNGLGYQSDNAEIDSSFIDAFVDDELTAVKTSSNKQSLKTKEAAIFESKSKQTTTNDHKSPNRGKSLYDCDGGKTAASPQRDEKTNVKKEKKKTPDQKEENTQRFLLSRKFSEHYGAKSFHDNAALAGSSPTCRAAAKESKRKTAGGGTWSKELIHKIVQQKNKLHKLHVKGSKNLQFSLVMERLAPAARNPAFGEYDYVSDSEDEREPVKIASRGRLNQSSRCKYTYTKECKWRARSERDQAAWRHESKECFQVKRRGSRSSTGSETSVGSPKSTERTDSDSEKKKETPDRPKLFKESSTLALTFTKSIKKYRSQNKDADPEAVDAAKSREKSSCHKKETKEESTQSAEQFDRNAKEKRAEEPTASVGHLMTEVCGQKDALHLYALDQGLVKSPLSFDTSSMFADLSGFDGGLYSEIQKKEECASSFSPFLEQRDWSLIDMPQYKSNSEKSEEKKADYDRVPLSLPEKIIDYGANLNGCASEDELEIKRIVNELENQLQTTKLESPPLLSENVAKDLQMSKFSPLRPGDESELKVDDFHGKPTVDASVSKLASEPFIQPALPWQSAFQFDLIGDDGEETLEQQRKAKKNTENETKENLEERQYTENLMRSLEVINDSIFTKQTHKEPNVTALTNQQHDGPQPEEPITSSSIPNINEPKQEMKLILSESSVSGYNAAENTSSSTRNQHEVTTSRGSGNVENSRRESIENNNGAKYSEEAAKEDRRLTPKMQSADEDDVRRSQPEEVAVGIAAPSSSPQSDLLMLSPSDAIVAADPRQTTPFGASLESRALVFEPSQKPEEILNVQDIKEQLPADFMASEQNSPCREETQGSPQSPGEAAAEEESYESKQSEGGLDPVQVNLALAERLTSPLPVNDAEPPEMTAGFEKSDLIYDLKLSPLNYSSAASPPGKDVDSALILNESETTEAAPLNPEPTFKLVQPLVTQTNTSFTLEPPDEAKRSSFSSEDVNPVRSVGLSRETEKSSEAPAVESFSEAPPTLKPLGEAERTLKNTVLCEICLLCFRSVPGLKRHKAMKHSLKLLKRGTTAPQTTEKESKNDSQSVSAEMSNTERDSIGHPNDPQAKSKKKNKAKTNKNWKLNPGPFSDEILNMLKTDILQAITPEFKSSAPLESLKQTDDAAGNEEEPNVSRETAEAMTDDDVESGCEEPGNARRETLSDLKHEENGSPLSGLSPLRALLDDDATFSQLFPRDEEAKRKKCPRVYGKKSKRQKTDDAATETSEQNQEQHAKVPDEQKPGENQSSRCEYQTISLDDALMLNINTSLKADAEQTAEDVCEILGEFEKRPESSGDKSTAQWIGGLLGGSESSACQSEVRPRPLPSQTAEPHVGDGVQSVHNIDIQNINTTFQLPEIQFFDLDKDISVALPSESADLENREEDKSKKVAERRGRKRQDGGMKVKDKQYKCKVCFTWFLTLGELNFHKLSHNPSPPPTCYMCVQRKFSSREQLRDHLREKHAKNKTGIWTCGMCLKEISDVWMYNEHLREHATQFARRGQTQGSMLGISGCYMQETAVKNFLSSIMQHRSTKANRTAKDQEKGAGGEAGAIEGKTSEGAEPKLSKSKSVGGASGKQKTLTPLEVLHKTETPRNVEMHPNCKDPSRDCHHCGKQFPKPFKLQRHLVVHNLEKIFLCPKCPVSYQEAQELREHLKKAHQEVDEPDSKHTTLYTCELCADVMHVIKKSFICSTCNYTFSKKEQFDRHMEKHRSGGNKIFKFRGVLRPIGASAPNENRCDSPASKKRRILSDSLAENSSDSGIASVGSQSAEASKPSTADDSTQTVSNECHTNNTNVKTEDVAEDYSQLLVELEKCARLGSPTSLTPKEEEEAQSNVENQSGERSDCEVKEEDQSVCVPEESGAAETLNSSVNVNQKLLETPELANQDEGNHEQSPVQDKEPKVLFHGAEPDSGSQIKDIKSWMTESPPVLHSKVFPNVSKEERDSAKPQKKRKEMKSAPRVSSPTTQENFGVDAKVRKKFRPSKCANAPLQRKSDGAADYAVLSSVRDDAVGNKIISKSKTVNVSLQTKRSLLDSCAQKKSDIVTSQNGDFKARKGLLGKSLHNSKVSSVPMNNYLNKPRPKMGVRSVDGHSYRTAESQNNLLSQLFGQKLTSFKIPLRKDTSESIN